MAWGQNKVNINNLVKYGNKYFKENDDIPYDGTLFDLSKETGNKTLQFLMVNVLKNGSYQEWCLNGRPKIKGEYINDDSTGLWTWYDNGRKKIEKTYNSIEMQYVNQVPKYGLV